VIFWHIIDRISDDGQLVGGLRFCKFALLAVT
jgi:hypothetical protein